MCRDFISPNDMKEINLYNFFFFFKKKNNKKKKKYNFTSVEGKLVHPILYLPLFGQTGQNAASDQGLHFLTLI